MTSAVIGWALAAAALAAGWLGYGWRGLVLALSVIAFWLLLQASRTLAIPVVSMAMGGLGAVSRVCGASFGSALTFAVGQSASAPGQMPIEDLSAALAVLRKAGGAGA